MLNGLHEEKVWDEEWDSKKTALLEDLLVEKYKAKKLGVQAGHGGSQEISCLNFKIDGKLVSIVNETYMGISLVGPREIVEPIADRVRVEWGYRTRS